jgi:hypothetical protein
MPALPDDDVIMHRYPERPRDVDDRAGHLDVRLRWRRIAGRVIVHQPTVRATAVISFGFWLSRPQQGTWTGGCRWELFVMIPLLHSPSRSMLSGHVRCPLWSPQRTFRSCGAKPEKGQADIPRPLLHRRWLLAANRDDPDVHFLSGRWSSQRPA